jgi:hypothetical protein
MGRSLQVHRQQRATASGRRWSRGLGPRFVPPGDGMPGHEGMTSGGHAEELTRRLARPR